MDENEGQSNTSLLAVNYLDSGSDNANRKYHKHERHEIIESY